MKKALAPSISLLLLARRAPAIVIDTHQDLPEQLQKKWIDTGEARQNYSGETARRAI